ncbi:MAG: hypothetical protein ACRDHU_06365 [Actinomycetota bacterium]
MNDAPVSMPTIDLVIPLLISFQERWPSAERALFHDRRQVSVDDALVETRAYDHVREQLLQALLQLILDARTDPTEDLRPRIAALSTKIERDLGAFGEAILERRGKRPD